MLQCRYCGSREVKKLIDCENKYDVLKEIKAFSLYVCADCRLYHILPIPSELQFENLYQSSYSGHAPNKRAINGYQKVLNNIRKYSVGLKMCDIGCNLGFFCNEAKKMGFDAVGLEVSENAAHYAHEKFGIEVMLETVESFSNDHCKEFDIVTHFHVIEHVSNPKTFIDASCSIVKDGGLLVVDTPNVDSLFARSDIRNWYYFDPPFHINYFGSNIIDFIKMRGFVLLKSHYSFAPSMIAKLLKLKDKNFQKGDAIPIDNFTNRNPSNTSIRRRFLEKCFDGFNLVTSHMKIGDSMLLYFKKVNGG